MVWPGSAAAAGIWYTWPNPPEKLFWSLANSKSRIRAKFSDSLIANGILKLNCASILLVMHFFAHPILSGKKQCLLHPGLHMSDCSRPTSSHHPRHPPLSHHNVGPGIQSKRSFWEEPEWMTTTTNWISHRIVLGLMWCVCVVNAKRHDIAV